MDRIYRIDHKGQPRYVIEQKGQWRLIDGDLFDGYEAGEPISSTGHRLLAPVMPSKIVCVGLNYKDHAAEVNKPLPRSRCSSSNPRRPSSDPVSRS